MENFSGSVVEPRSVVPPLPNIPSEMPPKNKKLILILVVIEVIVVLGFLAALLITLLQEPEGSITMDDVVEDYSSSEKPAEVDLYQEESLVLSRIANTGTITASDCRSFGNIYSKYVDIDIFPFEICNGPTVSVVAREVSINTYNDIEFYQVGLGDEKNIYTITTYDDFKMFYGVSYGATSKYEPKKVEVINE